MGRVTKKSNGDNNVRFKLDVVYDDVHAIKNALDFAVATCPENRWDEFRKAQAAFADQVENAEVTHDE